MRIQFNFMCCMCVCVCVCVIVFCKCDIILTVCPFYDRPIQFITYSLFICVCTFLRQRFSEIGYFVDEIFSYLFTKFTTSSSSSFEFAFAVAATVYCCGFLLHINSMSRFSNFYICSHFFSTICLLFQM